MVLRKSPIKYDSSRRACGYVGKSAESTESVEKWFFIFPQAKWPTYPHIHKLSFKNHTSLSKSIGSQVFYGFSDVAFSFCKLRSMRALCTVTAAWIYIDEAGMVEEPVNYSIGDGGICKDLAPFLEADI